MGSHKKFRIHLDDLDYMGIVSHYDWVRLMERYRTEVCKTEWKHLLSAGLGLVVVNTNVDYKYPARYDDELEFKLNVIELRNSSFSIYHEFKNTLTGKTCATGTLTFACIDQKTLKPTAMTPGFKSFLEKLK